MPDATRPYRNRVFMLCPCPLQPYRLCAPNNNSNCDTTGLPEKLTTALFRPEVRYDRSLNDTTPFGDGKHRDRWTFSGDIVLGF